MACLGMMDGELNVRIAAFVEVFVDVVLGFRGKDVRLRLFWVKMLVRDGIRRLSAGKERTEVILCLAEM